MSQPFLKILLCKIIAFSSPAWCLRPIPSGYSPQIIRPSHRWPASSYTNVVFVYISSSAVVDRYSSMFPIDMFQGCALAQASLGLSLSSTRAKPWSHLILYLKSIDCRFLILCQIPQPALEQACGGKDLNLRRSNG